MTEEIYTPQPPIFVDTINSITPLVADLIHSENIYVRDGSNNSLELAPKLLKLSDGSANSLELTSNMFKLYDASGGITSTLSYINDISGHRILNFSTTELNLNITDRLILNGVHAPYDGALIASTPTGLGWTTVSEFLQLDTNRVRNRVPNTELGIPVTAMTVTFHENIKYTIEPVIILTPDSDGSGQIIPVSLDGFTKDVNNKYTGFNVLFGSSKLKYFSYLVLPVATTVISGDLKRTTGGLTTAPTTTFIPANIN